MTCEFNDGGPTMDDIRGTAVDDPPPEIEAGDDDDDEHEHCWVMAPARTTTQRIGLWFRVEAVTRWAQWCPECGTVRFIDDPAGRKP